MSETDFRAADGRFKVICALVAVIASLIFVSVASAASVVRFNRVDYGDQMTVADAARYQIVALGYGSGTTSQAAVRQLIASIHARNPSVRILLYKNYTASPSDPQGIGGCAGWNSSQTNGGVPQSWFLRDASGAPMYSAKYAAYELDPGNAQVQNACVASAVAMAKAGGYDGILWDSINPSLFWEGISSGNCSSSSCTSDANWHAAMRSWVTNTSVGLHSAHLLSIGNIAGGAINWCCGSGSSIWQSYQQIGLDGAEEESFAIGTNSLPVSPAQWKQALLNELWSEANGKYMLGSGDAFSNQALNVYGLATLILGAQSYSSWDTASGNYSSGAYWFPQYDAALALGSPLGPYSVQSNGLYVRRFTNGTVVVNPTTSAIGDPQYGLIGAQSGRIGLGVRGKPAGAGRSTPTPPSNAKKLTCTAKSYNQSYPHTSGMAFGLLKCPKPFGAGVQESTFKESITAAKVKVTGKFTNFYDTGTLRGTYTLKGGLRNGQITATGPLKITGGTGAFNGARGMGKLTCVTKNGGKTYTCTATATATL